MPWHSSTAKDGGMELAVHYEVYEGGPDSSQMKRKRSAAILTINRNNINVIGPASIGKSRD